MTSNDSSFEELDPAKYPTPAPGTGQTSVTAGINPSEESEPVSKARKWSTLTTFERSFAIVIGLVVTGALIWGVSAFIAARFFH